MRNSFLKDYWLLIICILYRTIISVFISSTFIPDEYYQSVEPALRVSHGIGYLTWEWTDPFMIRSYPSILHYIFFFQLCRLTGLDHYHFIMSCGPRMIQSVLSGIADYGYYHIALIFSQQNQNIAYCCLLVHLFSWSSIYMYSRTLINVFESNLFIYFLSSALSRKKLFIHSFSHQITLWSINNINVWEIVLLTFSCYIRPSSVLLYAPILFCMNLHYLSQLKSIIHLFQNTQFYTSIIIFTSFLLVLVYIDYIYYQKLTFPPYSFYYVNITKDYASIFFGSKPWHWYFTSALPTLLGLYFPLLLSWCLLYISMNKMKKLSIENGFYSVLCIGIFVMIILSMISKHKEIRFLLPILPLFHLFIGRIIAQLYHFIPSFSSIIDMSEECTSKKTQIKPKNKKKKNSVYSSVLIIIVMTIIMMLIHIMCAGYLLLFHQVGTEGSFHFVSKMIITDVRNNNNNRNSMKISNHDNHDNTNNSHDSINNNRDSSRNYNNNDNNYIKGLGNLMYDVNDNHDNTLFRNLSIHLLAPCYTFPGYTYIINPRLNISLHSPDCFPQINHISESQQFRNGPSTFWGNKLMFFNEKEKGKRSIDDIHWNQPDYVITLNIYINTLKSLLNQNNCQEIKKIRHAHFHYDYDDENFPSYVIIYHCHF